MSRRFGPKSLFSSLMTLPVLAAIGLFLTYSSCGDGEINLYKGAAESSAKNDKDAQLEEARILMDKKDYDAAASLLSGIVEDSDQDSNEARLLFAAAKLGVAKLDIWSIISAVLDGQSSASSSGGKSSGMDTIFDAISDSVLGEGEDRTARVAALVEAINTLRSAPSPDESKVNNTACILAGILVVPTIADAKTAMTAAVSALESIKAAAQSGGTECPNISLLDTATANVAKASSQFSLVLEAASNCSFLDFKQAQNMMNTVETQMKKLIDNTDKGCSALPTCPSTLPSCHDLFPVCVQQALELGTSSAVAGDGVISSCELTLNCAVTGACFK